MATMHERAQIPVSAPHPEPLPSYWHTPLSPIANTIEPEVDNQNPKINSSTDSPSLPKIYDFTIIGSGISGTLLSYFLLSTNPSLSILMLEARSTCSGATGRNGGHTKAASYRSYLQNKAELGKEEALKIVRMEWENIRATHKLARDLGIEQKSESVECSTVDVVYDEGGWVEGKRAIEELRADCEEGEREEGAVAWYRMHKASEENLEKFHVRGRNSNPEAPEEEEVKGFFEYAAGRIHAYRFSTSILKICIQKGLVLATHTPVQSITPHPSTTSSSPLWSIQTPHSTLSSHRVIVATNAYTPSLLPTFQSSIVPLRGQIIASRPSPTSILPCPLPRTYSFIYRGGYEYMISRPVHSTSTPDSPTSTPPKQDQDIIIGGGLGRLPAAGASEFGTTNDSTLNPTLSTYLHATLPGYFASPSTFTVQTEWTGILAATSDGRPFVGQVEGMEGVWVCAGFNGHGMVLCLKSAEALAEKVIGGKWPGWWPGSFGVGERRLKGEFGGRRDMQVSSKRSER